MSARPGTPSLHIQAHCGIDATAAARRRSSVVERTLGKGEVRSSILRGGTTYLSEDITVLVSIPSLSLAATGGTRQELVSRNGEKPETVFPECSRPPDPEKQTAATDGGPGGGNQISKKEASQLRSGKCHAASLYARPVATIASSPFGPGKVALLVRGKNGRVIAVGAFPEYALRTYAGRLEDCA